MKKLYILIALGASYVHSMQGHHHNQHHGGGFGGGMMNNFVGFQPFVQHHHAHGDAHHNHHHDGNGGWMMNMHHQHHGGGFGGGMMMQGNDINDNLQMAMITNDHNYAQQILQNHLWQINWELRNNIVAHAQENHWPNTAAIAALINPQPFVQHHHAHGDAHHNHHHDGNGGWMMNNQHHGGGHGGGMMNNFVGFQPFVQHHHAHGDAHHNHHHDGNGGWMMNNQHHGGGFDGGWMMNNFGRFQPFAEHHHAHAGAHHNHHHGHNGGWMMNMHHHHHGGGHGGGFMGGGGGFADPVLARHANFLNQIGQHNAAMMAFLLDREAMTAWINNQRQRINMNTYAKVLNLIENQPSFGTEVEHFLARFPIGQMGAQDLGAENVMGGQAEEASFKMALYVMKDAKRRGIDFSEQKFLTLSNTLKTLFQKIVADKKKEREKLDSNGVARFKADQEVFYMKRLW